jgi:NitT/TauT family transport system substrate-binding protein
MASIPVRDSKEIRGSVASVLLRWSGAFCVLLLFLRGLVACDSPATLDVAYHPFVGYESLPLAEDLGWLSDRVVLHRLESSEDSMRALEQGRVQAAALTLDEALRLRDRLPGVTVVLIMDESAGSDVLLARPGVGGLDGLAGARVAYQRDSVSELLLISALRQVSLSLDDIEQVHLTGASLVDAFERGEVDAVVAYPPFSEQIAQLGAQRLFDSSEIPGIILDVLVVDTRQLVNREELLAGLIDAHFTALEHLRTNHEDFVYRYAEYQQNSSQNIRAALSGIRLPSLMSVRRDLSPGGKVQTAADVMIDSGLVPRPRANASDLMTTRFLPRQTR